MANSSAKSVFDRENTDSIIIMDSNYFRLYDLIGYKLNGSNHEINEPISIGEGGTYNLIDGFDLR